MKHIRKNRPRCRYVYYCSLQGTGEGNAVLTDEEIDRKRCVLPSGHRVGGGKKPWNHEHITADLLRFDHNCDCLIEDVRKDWDYYHSDEFLKQSQVAEKV